MSWLMNTSSMAILHRLSQHPTQMHTTPMPVPHLSRGDHQGSSRGETCNDRMAAASSKAKPGTAAGAGKAGVEVGLAGHAPSAGQRIHAAAPLQLCKLGSLHAAEVCSGPQQPSKPLPTPTHPSAPAHVRRATPEEADDNAQPEHTHSGVQAGHQERQLYHSLGVLSLNKHNSKAVQSAPAREGLTNGRMHAVWMRVCARVCCDAAILAPAVPTSCGA